MVTFSELSNKNPLALMPWGHLNKIKIPLISDKVSQHGLALALASDFFSLYHCVIRITSHENGGYY